MSREYNPRLRPVQQQANLTPAVRSAQLYSYDEKRPDYVAYPSGAGLEWQQLAKALGEWEPGLQKYAEKKGKEDSEALWATVQHLGQLEENIGLGIAQLTQKYPDKIPDSPIAHRALNALRMQNEAVAFNSALNAAYTENGWASLPMAEAQLKAQEFTGQFHTGLAQKYGEDAAESIGRYFTPQQLQSTENLMKRHDNDRRISTMGEMETTFAQACYNIMEQGTDDPAFFHPDNLEQNLYAKGQQLQATGEFFSKSGHPPAVVNEWLADQIFSYAGKLDAGANDFRGDDFLHVADFIQTGPGFLSGTAKYQARMAQFGEDATQRRNRAESHEWQRQERAKKEEQERLTQAIVYGIADKPGAAPTEVLQAAGLALTPDNLDAVVKYSKVMEAASDIQETPENRLFAAELAVQQMEGKVALPEILVHFRQGRLTLGQWNSLKGEAPKEPGFQGQMAKMTKGTGLEEAEAFIRKTHAVPDSSEQTDKVAAYYRAETAATLFKNAVYGEIETRLERGLPCDYDDVVRIVERHKAPLGDPNNQLVIETAKARQDGTIRFDALEEPQRLYQETVQRGGAASGFTIPQESAIAYAPAESLRLLDAASQETGVDRLLLYSVAHVESAFNTNAQNPVSSAYGLMQLVKGTAEWEGVDQRDPAQNALGGARHLARIQKMHNLPDTPEGWELSYMYYHDGPGHTGEFSPEAKAGAQKVVQVMTELKQHTQDQATDSTQKAYTSALQTFIPTPLTLLNVMGEMHQDRWSRELEAFKQVLEEQNMPVPTLDELRLIIRGVYKAWAIQAPEEEVLKFDQALARYRSRIPTP